MDPEVLNLGERAASVNMGLFWLEKVEGQDYGRGGGGGDAGWRSCNQVGAKSLQDLIEHCEYFSGKLWITSPVRRLLS